jgi:hypothetical protein
MKAKQFFPNTVRDKAKMQFDLPEAGTIFCKLHCSQEVISFGLITK